MSNAGTALIGVILVFAFAIGLVAPVEAQSPVRIGASLSLTGTYAELGQMFRRGYQLCVKSTNATGGVLGRRLELVVEDDGSQAAAAARMAHRDRHWASNWAAGPVEVAFPRFYETLGRDAEFVSGTPRFPTPPWSRRP